MDSSEKTAVMQAGTVPYRIRQGRPEFCLITSIRKGAWGFPKGLIDPGETPEEAALKESEEEGGLHGHIVGDPLGQYEYRKWGTALLVTVYLMQVTAVDDDWEEADVRQRRWCRAEKARAALERHELRELLDAALEQIGEGCD